MFPVSISGSVPVEALAPDDVSEVLKQIERRLADAGTSALVISAVSFGYFWLLNRVSGSWLWWLVLLGGVFLLA